MAPAIDWTQYEQLKAEGLVDWEIARRWGIPWGTFHREKQRYTEARLRTLTPQSATVHPSTPALRRLHTPVHSGPPMVREPTRAHPSTPMPSEFIRMLSLLPDLEIMVAREQDRQRLLSTPIGTPRHTQKKTYVVGTLYVDLIERCAQAEGLELKDVVNLAFHEVFEHRKYLPLEG